MSFQIRFLLEGGGKNANFSTRSTLKLASVSAYAGKSVLIKIIVQHI